MKQQVALLETVLNDAESQVRAIELRVLSIDGVDAESLGEPSPSNSLGGANDPRAGAMSRAAGPSLAVTGGVVTGAGLLALAGGGALRLIAKAARDDHRPRDRDRARYRSDLAFAAGLSLVTAGTTIIGLDWLWVASPPKARRLLQPAPTRKAWFPWVVGFRGALPQP